MVAPLNAAVQWMAPPDHFGRSLLTIEWGDENSPVEIAARLRSFGYKEKDLVSSSGEFALRGGILDLFSPAEETPVRMEFFGNRIESMRTFDAATQRSQKEIERTTVLALKEMQLTPADIEAWARFAEKRFTGGFYQEELTDKTEQLLEFGSFEGYEEFAKAFFEKPATLLDYLPENCCVLLDEPVLLEQAYFGIASRIQKTFRSGA